MNIVEYGRGEMWDFIVECVGSVILNIPSNHVGGEKLGKYFFSPLTKARHLFFNPLTNGGGAYGLDGYDFFYVGKTKHFYTKTTL